MLISKRLRRAGQGTGNQFQKMWKFYQGVYTQKKLRLKTWPKGGNSSSAIAFGVALTKPAGLGIGLNREFRLAWNITRKPLDYISI